MPKTSFLRSMSAVMHGPAGRMPSGVWLNSFCQTIWATCAWRCMSCAESQDQDDMVQVEIEGDDGPVDLQDEEADE